MKAQIRSRWIEALRSGEFEQLTDMLKGSIYKNNQYGEQDYFSEPIKDGYCCLGVLATLVDPEHITWENDDPCFGSLEHKEQYTEAQREKFKEQIALIGQELPTDKLIELNDVERKSFLEIANWIEWHIPVTE